MEVKISEWKPADAFCGQFDAKSPSHMGSPRCDKCKFAKGSRLTMTGLVKIRCMKERHFARMRG